MVQTTQIINVMLYSGPAQNSYIPVNGSISENILNLDKIKLSAPPLWIALRQQILIIGSCNEVHAINTADCELLFKEDIRLNFNFMCSEDGILINDFSDWRSYDSQKITSYFISAPKNIFLTNFHKQINNYWYGYYITEMPIARGEKLNYWFQFNRHLPEQESFDWYYRVNGKALGSLTTLDNKTFFVIMPNQIHHFPVDATSENAVTKFDVPFITSFALDHKGVLTLVVQDSGIYYLKQFSYSGEELWKVTLPGISQSKQPPASSPQGTIYYGESNSIVAVENSEVKWRLPLSKEPAFFYITVLADNSLLVASGNTLYAISEDGKIAKTVTIPFTITCRPIMGLDGAVYVGGSGGIACLK